MIFVDVLIKDYIEKYYNDVAENYINLENCNGSKYFSKKEKNEIEGYRVKYLVSFYEIYNRVRDDIKSILLTSYEDDIEEIIALSLEDLLCNSISNKLNSDLQNEIYNELKSNFYIHYN